MINEAIIKTLQYSAHFNFPLTKHELYHRLIAFQTTHQKLLTGLNKLIVSRQVLHVDNYYCLPTDAHTIKLRQSRLKTSQSKKKLAHKYATWLARTPGVIAIYLTGSLAVNNATPSDDIDFMIITQAGRLWLTRLLLTLLSEALGIRRRPNARHTNNQLCLNLYLTPTSLSIPPTKRNLYTAYELIQATPLYDPTDTQTQLLNANLWLCNYLPNWEPRSDVLSRSDLLSKSRHGGMFSRVLTRSGQTLMCILESLLYHLQLLYMRGKITSEYITRDQAFFHPHSQAPKNLW